MDNIETSYKIFFNHAGIALSVLDADGKILLVNDKFQELCGVSKVNIEDKKNLLDFLSGKNASLIKNYLRADAVFNNSKNWECKFNSQTGQKINVLLSLTRLPDETKIFVSLTETTSIQKAIRNSLRAKHQQNIAKIASGIAHEIRNPLSAINTSIEILSGGLDISGQDLELMNIILEENKRLDHIIREFTQFARIEEPELKMININKIIEETLDLISDNIQPDINLILELSERLQPTLADQRQLKSALINIITNAWEAMPNGGEIQISTSLSKNDLGEDQILITITDTGCGINQVDLTKVFRPFFPDKEKNMGMGLAICERIIENHNGEINIQSVINQGTTVSIFLPVNIRSNFI